MQLVWFRKDLRLNDNPALYQSCLNGPTQAIYFITPAQWQKHDVASIQIDLMERVLNSLSEALGQRGIPLHIINVPHFKDIPLALSTFCAENAISVVHANAEIEINEFNRDNLVQAQLNRQQGQLNLYQADCLISPGEVQTKQGTQYKVFTPFKNCCLNMLRERVNLSPYPAPLNQSSPVNNPVISIPLNKINSDAWVANEQGAHKHLQDFINFKVEDYHQQRDFPALTATSQLGPYLALGIISVKQCVYYLLQDFPTVLDGQATGATVWLNELLWREFYRHLMVLNPAIGKGKNYKKQADTIIWDNSTEHFKAWCEGKTGYPLVDAAMLQLKQTGWMHNRLRMVCASFLTKHLLIDWRWGEKYFKQQLIDGDFASNNGGWQWAASTGCDAQPYFRIFNPTLQSKKFDPKGDFIRIYLQERQKVSNKQLHEPINPIVEHKFARQRTLLRYSVLKADNLEG